MYVHGIMQYWAGQFGVGGEDDATHFLTSGYHFGKYMEYLAVKNSVAC